MAAVALTRTGSGVRLWLTAHRHRRPRVHRLGSAALDGTARAQPLPSSAQANPLRLSGNSVPRIHPSSPEPQVSGALLGSMPPLLQGCSPHHSACHGASSRTRDRVPRERVGDTVDGDTRPPSVLLFVTPRTALALATLPLAPGAVGVQHGQGPVDKYSIPPGTRHCWVASSWRSRHRETDARAATL